MTALATTLFLGAVVGGIYSLAAFGLVLTYRASGVFNFAQGAIGMFFAYVFYQLIQGGQVDLIFMVHDAERTLPTAVALVVVVGILAPAVGWVLDAILFRHLRTAGEVVQIVATIGLLVAVQGMAGVMWGAATTLTPTSIFSEHPLVAGGFRATVEQVAGLGFVLAIAAGLVAFLRYSTLGIRMRAVVDRPDLAELAGVDSARISALSWAMGTGFAALAGILIVPHFGSLDPLTLTFLVVPATAAAMIGRLENIQLTLAGGAAIGVAQFIVQRYTDSEIARQLGPSIPFVVLFAVLFLPRWKRRPTDRTVPPPIPPVERVMTAGDRALRVGLLAVVLVAAPFLLDVEWQVHLSRVPAMAIIFLSLVILSGYGGQVSLCQAALAGFGAFSMAHLVSGFGVPFPVAVLAGGVAAVPLGAFLAVRAATLSPLFLGFATLAFGAVMDEVLFTSRWFAHGLAGVFFDRPDALHSPRAYYLVTLAIFALLAWGVSNLRRSRTGLALAAMRDSEIGLSALGVSVPRLKHVVFCLSAFMAGLGGALWSAADGLATPLSYFMFQSLIFLALAVIGGIGAWSGALAGAILFQMAPAFAGRGAGGNLQALLPVFFGLGAIALARNPHGFVEQVRSGVARFLKPHVREVAEVPAEPAVVDDAPAVVVPGGGLFHRSDCLLVSDKETSPARRRSNAEPCPVCEPAPQGSRGSP